MFGMLLLTRCYKIYYHGRPPQARSTLYIIVGRITERSNFPALHTIH